MVRTATILVAAIGFLAASATAAEVTGPVRVIDGDTLDLAGTRIRLWGIDAPETGRPVRVGTARPTNADATAGP
jgi:endonuclease YncB( thermonuclease family)